MAAPSRTGRSRVTLVLLILLSITLLTLDFRGFGPIDRARDSFTALFDPVRSGVSTAFDPVGDAWNNAFADSDLRAENEELRQQVEELQGQIIRNQDAAQELAVLKEALNIPFLESIDTQLATVVSGPVGNFNDYVFEIDQGSRAGIAEDMPVISPGGLVGRIAEVGPNRSRVTLMNQPGFQVGVKVSGQDNLAIALGLGLGEPLEVSNGIPLEAPINDGDVVVTSGLDRSFYPGGIPIGRVVDTRLDDDGFEKVLVVEPAADLENIDVVTVVLFTPRG